MRIIYLKKGYQLAKRARALMKNTTPARLQNIGNNPAPIVDRLPAAFFVFVMGSGGHTTEMFEFIRNTMRPAPNVHRRYIWTTEDHNSVVAVFHFENDISEKYPRNAGGTWDSMQIQRARDIHQPLYTAWFTALLSISTIYTALTTVPHYRNTASQRKNFQFPHVITTNGPGSGLMVALVARLMKIFFMVPAHTCMKVMFVETWAHVQTFSLTGMLFHYGTKVAGLADVFQVQHKPLSEKYGYPVFDFIEKGFQ